MDSKQSRAPAHFAARSCSGNLRKLVREAMRSLEALTETVGGRLSVLGSSRPREGGPVGRSRLSRGEKLSEVQAVCPLDPKTAATSRSGQRTCKAQHVPSWAWQGKRALNAERPTPTGGPLPRFAGGPEPLPAEEPTS